MTNTEKTIEYLKKEIKLLEDDGYDENGGSYDEIEIELYEDLRIYKKILRMLEGD